MRVFIFSLYISIHFKFHMGSRPLIVVLAPITVFLDHLKDISVPLWVCLLQIGKDQILARLTEGFTLAQWNNAGQRSYENMERHTRWSYFIIMFRYLLKNEQIKRGYTSEH